MQKRRTFPRARVADSAARSADVRLELGELVGGGDPRARGTHAIVCSPAVGYSFDDQSPDGWRSIAGGSSEPPARPRSVLGSAGGAVDELQLGRSAAATAWPTCDSPRESLDSD